MDRDTAAGHEDAVALLRLADLATPMAVRVAATLRVADLVASGAGTLGALAEATHTDPRALDTVLRHLVSVGLLGGDGRHGYTLTRRAGPLLADHPDSVRARLDLEGALGGADVSFVHLLHAVRTGESAFARQFGVSFWENLSDHPALAAGYDATMGADVAAQAPAVAAAFDWGAFGHVVDVGGGNGTLLVALLRAFPRLRGTVVDLPAAAGAARAALDAAGVAGRATAVAGSFFDALPADADGYLLCEVLHNWDDSDASAILRRCAEAAAPGGRVLVVERVGGEGPVDTARALLMLAYFGGRERTVDEISALATGVGLELVAVHGAGRGSLIELTLPRPERS